MAPGSPDGAVIRSKPSHRKLAMRQDCVDGATQSDSPKAAKRMPRKGLVMFRKVALGEDDEKFDAEFWSRLTPEQRIQATRQATLDWAAMQGMDERDLRVKRSVVRLIRR